MTQQTETNQTVHSSVLDERLIKRRDGSQEDEGVYVLKVWLPSSPLRSSSPDVINSPVRLLTYPARERTSATPIQTSNEMLTNLNSELVF